MKIYLVGGCVRDKLLGLESGDRDWVVVGATDAQMRQKGFKKVGAHFPVYLHPQTHEEYALARLERKEGQGYGGFAIQADPSVTLEDDLRRRDLTINAIAWDCETEQHIDPFGGSADLEAGILRHVSGAFADDPLRLVRLARFAAFFPKMRIAAETEDMARHIVQSGELRLLPAERITLEIEKTYGKAASAERFWGLLESWGALPQLLPSYEEWATALPALSDSSNVAPSARWSRALAQLLQAVGSPLWEAFLQGLCVPTKQQRLAQLTVSWWKLIAKGPPEPLKVATLLSQHRLYQNRQMLEDLEPVLAIGEQPDLVRQALAFTEKLAAEPPRLWLEQYPPNQRRERLEQYYAQEAEKFFPS